MSSIQNSGTSRAPRRALLAPLLLLALAVVPATAQEAPGLVVRQLSFQGNDHIADEVLAASIATTNSSWLARMPVLRGISVLGEKRYLDEQQFRRDVLRVLLLYRRSGFLEASVDTLVHRTDRDAWITFVIDEGPPVLVTRLAVAGIAGFAEREELERDLPLEVGEPFDRLLMQTSADTLVRRLRNRGYPSARVFPGFTVERAERTAEVSFDVDPGPPARIGSIEILGVSRLDTTLVRNLLAIRTGQPYSQEDLTRSQVSLYRTDLFRFASVEVDSGFVRGDTLVPVRVQVNEGRFHRIQGGMGYGTDDCLRFSTAFTQRNVLGDGRTLDLSARVGKVGVGKPFDWGLADNICSSLAGDSLASGLATYQVAATVRKPVFLSYRNVGTATIFAGRRSEVRVYRREELGFGVGLTRASWRLLPLTVQYRLSYGRTIADEATYCANFNACTPRDIDLFEERRLLGTISVGTSLIHTNNPLDPSRGWVTDLEVTHSSRFTGSSDLQAFTRGVVDYSAYRPIGQGAVLAWRLRGGYILAPAVPFTEGDVSFVPPEQRFYAGGPNDVRGFERNELGPVVYVAQAEDIPPDPDDIDPSELRFSATGGNTLAIGNVELRMPAPFLSNRFRIGLFVDAGGLWELGGQETVQGAFAITPGIGFRLATPLGPARADLAWNPYGRQSGALYREEENGGLTLVTDDFSAPRSSGFTFHFAVGHAF